MNVPQDINGCFISQFSARFTERMKTRDDMRQGCWRYAGRISRHTRLQRYSLYIQRGKPEIKSCTFSMNLSFG